MRIETLLGEAWRNVVSGTARVTALSLVFGVLLTSLTLVDAVVVGGIVRDARDYQARGAATVTVIAPQRISGVACESLARIDGVESVGALRASDDELKLAVLPRSPVPIHEVSPGFAATLDATVHGAAGVFVPTDVIEATGVETGDFVMTDGGLASIAGTYAYPSDGRRAGFGWVMLVPVAEAGTFDECWVRVWPWNDGMQSVIRGAVLTVSESGRDNVEVIQSQLNTQLGARFDGYDRFSERVTRYAPLVALLVGGVLASLTVRIRRLELASRLHDGSRRRDVLLQAVLENLAWLIPTFLLASAVALTYASTIGAPDATHIANRSFVTTAAGLLGGLLGTVIAVPLVRERHLFVYFKDR